MFFVDGHLPNNSGDRRQEILRHVQLRCDELVGGGLFSSQSCLNAERSSESSTHLQATSAVLRIYNS